MRADFGVNRKPCAAQVLAGGALRKHRAFFWVPVGQIFGFAKFWGIGTFFSCTGKVFGACLRVESAAGTAQNLHGQSLPSLTLHFLDAEEVDRWLENRGNARVH